MKGGKMNKKIMLAILFMLMQITSVHANIIWSEVERDDLKLLEKEERYKFYKEIIEGEYILKGEQNNKYSYEDRENIIYSEYTSLKDECDEAIYLDTKQVKVYPFQKIRRTRYLEISNMSNDIVINNLEVFNEQEKIAFVMKDRQYDPVKKISKNDSILIDLAKEYITKKITLSLNTDNQEFISYDLKFMDDDGDVSLKIEGNTDQNLYYIGDYIVDSSYLLPISYAFERLEGDDETIVLEEKEMCQERKIFTYRFNKKRVYYDDDYHVSISDPSYIKSLQESKIFYKYLISDYIQDQNYENNVNQEIFDSSSNDIILKEKEATDISSIAGQHHENINDIIKPLKIDNKKIIIDIIGCTILIVAILLLIIIKVNKKMSK